MCLNDRITEMCLYNLVFPRATALYFIDKLALRAGNEKDTDETADTVGCCSLRVEHISEFLPCAYLPPPFEGYTPFP